jgi:cold shock CspA family protein
MKGTIVRIMGDKDFGFIQGEDNKDYFFHRTALQNIEFTQRLTGLSVEFEDTQTSKGLRAEHVFVE